MLSVAVRHRFGGFLLDVAFEGPGDGVTVLFGASGAGKSATLAAIGGAVTPEHGRVALGDRVLTDREAAVFVPPERRRIGWVHQDARLFPHLSVVANLRYGQRRARGRKGIGFDEVVEVLGINDLLDRSPRALSGGEKQRVSLGRALLSQPDLLLLDEPLAALDRPRKDEIMTFVKALKARFVLPMVYVTHVQAEARILGDHVVLIDEGRVVAQGAPHRMLLDDNDSLDGAVVDGRIVEHLVESGRTRVTEDGRDYIVPAIAGAIGSKVRLRIVVDPSAALLAE